MSFKALWVTETADGKMERNIIERNIDDLPTGEVLIRVHYSALNYKDALSATGNNARAVRAVASCAVTKCRTMSIALGVPSTSLIEASWTNSR